MGGTRAGAAREAAREAARMAVVRWRRRCGGGLAMMAAGAAGGSGDVMGPAVAAI